MEKCSRTLLFSFFLQPSSLTCLSIHSTQTSLASKASAFMLTAPADLPAQLSRMAELLSGALSLLVAFAGSSISALDFTLM